MKIDISKPKQTFEVSTPEHVTSALPVAVPDFFDDFVHIPADEPINVPKDIANLYSDCNRDLTHQELTALWKHAAD